MATYIQGLTDYIPQIQPFQPDLNFYGNVMQTRQTRFDAATKKVNDLYGSLLYSPLSRDGNIKRRQEFFKAIDNDIKRISGLDLSLKQNEDQALAVFKGFYDDKYMLADMVKTKNAYNELEKGENYKYCTDKEKCNGQYWEQGIKKLHYKLDEFKNVSDEESLNFQIGEYDPYFDWKKEAVDKVTKLGYDVKMDTPSGKWIVRDANGKLVEGGLYNLYTSLYGDDPRVKNNYDTEAYVARKDYGAAFKGTYGSQEEAEKEYIMKVINQGMSDTRKELSEIGDKYDEMNVKSIKLEKKLANKTITAKERADLELINQQKPILELSKKTLENRLSEIQTNIDANDINGLRQRADLSAATTYQKRDLENLAKSLGQIKQSRTLEADPYTKMYEQFGIDKALAKYKAQLESQLLTQKGKQDIDLELIKQGLQPGAEGVSKQPVEGLPGSTFKENIEEKPDLYYERNREEILSKLSQASSNSVSTLYKLFNAAKKAKDQNATLNKSAVNFLKQFGDDKTINSITNVEGLQKLIANKKLGSIALFQKFVNDSKAPGFDHSWAKAITDNPKDYAEMINEVSLANQAFDKLLQKSKNVNKTIIDKMASTAGADNQLGFFAKDLIDPATGNITTKDRFIKKAMTTAAKHNIGLGLRDAENVYDAIKTQFYDNYNSAENVSLMQEQGLPGLGQTTATPVRYVLDLAKKGVSKTTSDIVDLTDKAFGDIAKTKTVIGDISKESFEKAHNPAIKEFLTWYMHQYKNPNSPSNRPLTALVSNVAGERSDMSAVTFTGFDPDAIKAYEGTTKAKGPFFNEKVLEKGLTMFFDNTKIQNPFNTPMSNAEIVLKTSGGFTDSGFDGAAGNVTYTLDGNEVTALWEKDIFNGKTGEWDKKEYTYHFPISKLERSRGYIIAEQNALAEQNKQIEEAYIKYHQSR